LVFNSILIATSTCVAVPETNLLLNPGAEQGQNELPSFWREAAIGADGLKMYRDDGQAHSGKFSFAISNTHKYPQTVCNNWAQNIMDVPAGKTVRLSAYIKTEEADSVNVCLQCWAAENNMLAFASTPVFRETQDWVLVQSQPVVVPPHTSYICVRAVLTGLGKAWFDDISLAVVDTPTEVSNDNKESEHIIDQHGNVDNIAIANNDGGVRTLLAWPQIKPDNVNDPNCTFLIALYSRKTTSKPPAGIVEAYEILKDWPERTSWETRPSIAEKPAAKCKFVPGKGWRLFDITPLIRGQLQDKRKCYGLMLRFAQEKRSAEKNNWSGYAFVSREGIGQWLSRRPRLLIVTGQKERKADEPD
jgi:hypothetical protein